MIKFFKRINNDASGSVEEDERYSRTLVLSFGSISKDDAHISSL
jgi:hypothetical protein